MRRDLRGLDGRNLEVGVFYCFSMVCVWSAFPAHQLHSLVFPRLGVEILVCLKETFNLVEDAAKLAACLLTGFETNPDKEFEHPNQQNGPVQRRVNSQDLL
jgi:hypothetical protein